MNTKRLLGLLLALATAGCTPDQRPELPDGRITDLKIVVTPGPEPNIYLLRTNRTDVIGFWDLGNGHTASGVNSVTARYPFPGNYTVTLTAYGDNGRTNDVSVKLAVPEENLYLLDDPMYTYIAGEIGGPGKTWMLDAQRPYHIDLLDPDDPTESWWHAGPDEKADRGLYDDEATFYLDRVHGQGFDYVNNGRSCTLNHPIAALELLNDGAWNATAVESVGDYVISCTPPADMGWSLVQTGGRYYIAFPPTSAGHGGYLFYFCGWNTQYEVRAIGETHMKVFLWTTINGSRSLRALILRTRETPSDDRPIRWLWSQPD